MAVRSGSWSVGGVKLPEFGITEKIGSILNKPKTAQGGSNIFGSSLAAKASPSRGVLGASTGQLPSFSATGGAPSGQSARILGGGGGSYSSYAPATSGQASYSGDSGGGDEGGGYDYIQSLRDAFGQSRSALEGMLPTYDADFANFKSGVEGGITRAKDTLATQNAEDERIFGQDLKKTLQTDQELRQRRQGLYSGLNALDSSQYLDDTTQADQALREDTQSLDAEKRRNYDARQKEYSAYEQQATSQIAAYQNEIQRAKQGLQQAIASVNMDEASSIQNYISQLQQQQQQIDSNLQSFALSLAQLQAQGTDVVGNLGKLNMGAFSNVFGQKLANRYNTALSRYTPQQTGFQGAGYIGRGMTEDQKRQLGI